MMLLGGCELFGHWMPPQATRGSMSCEQASHALRVHDAKIATIEERQSFTITLASRGYATYRCTKAPGDQLACVTPGAANVVATHPEVTRMHRERDVLQARAATVCKL